MSFGTINGYASELRETLGRTLCFQDAEEIATEATNHLFERAAELELAGLSTREAEQQAVYEFGDLSELAMELTKGYPPRPPVDPSRIKWLPEIVLAVTLALAAFSFSIYRGARGLEAAAQNLIPSMAMLMVPGLTAGLSRLKYRRLRALAVLTRMANYGMILNLCATACLVGLQMTGKATLVSIFPVLYVFSAASTLMYAVMRITFTDGKLYRLMRSR